jgi:hypothetical protein
LLLHSFHDMADDGASAKGMDSVDTTNELGRLASRIIPHILNLYSSTRDLHLVLHGVLGILSLIGHETFSSCLEDMGAEKLHKS